MQIAAHVRLGVNKRQWLVLENLLKREASSHEVLEMIVYGDDPSENPKLGICHIVRTLRPKLEPLGVEILNLYGIGYSISLAQRKKLSAFLASDEE